jgi:hypothetical protein
MEQRVHELFRQLAFLGYGMFEINHIMQEAAGDDNLKENPNSQWGEVIATLEKYVELGSNYLEVYSK